MLSHAIHHLNTRYKRKRGGPAGHGNEAFLFIYLISEMYVLLKIKKIICANKKILLLFDFFL